jgi:hypothetical protein
MNGKLAEVEKRFAAACVNAIDTMRSLREAQRKITGVFANGKSAYASAAKAEAVKGAIEAVDSGNGIEYNEEDLEENKPEGANKLKEKLA